MTTENDRSYFRDHPEYHMYLHPEQPSYASLIAARDRFVARHPKLSFVGAHLASLEWSVDELATFLDSHPNATADLAARMTQVQYQSQSDRGKVRRFFVKYQDRLLYGSDLTENPPDPHERAQNPPLDPAQFTAEADTLLALRLGLPGDRGGAAHRRHQGRRQRAGAAEVCHRQDLLCERQARIRASAARELDGGVAAPYSITP